MPFGLLAIYLPTTVVFYAFSDEIRVEMNNGMKITDGTKYLHSLKRISKKLSKIEAVDWIQILNEDTPANEKRSASNQILNEDTPANEKRSAYLLKPVNNRFWCSAKEEIYGEIKILAAYTGQQDFQNEIQDMLNKAQESSFCHIL